MWGMWASAARNERPSVSGRLLERSLIRHIGLHMEQILESIAQCCSALVRQEQRKHSSCVRRFNVPLLVTVYDMGIVSTSLGPHDVPI